MQVRGRQRGPEPNGPGQGGVGLDGSQFAGDLGPRRVPADDDPGGVAAELPRMGAQEPQRGVALPDRDRVPEFGCQRVVHAGHRVPLVGEQDGVVVHGRR